ncbi:ABC transporter ATP-binding protein [Zhihengliuella halotolerans]|uniref:ABC transporter ATP-binding protein n=1 Tax=Zhihengliuella halotolerans TaxID=370736 RepID=UPI000C808E56|nr:ABC transporter ATP-binding protein [Zhihengliuella halotolerans]
MKLELKGITKAFGDFVANDGIDLVVDEGKVHTLLGENGAGKSTLMNVLYGLYEPTAGEILVNGAPVHFRGPGDAMAAGIGMVHQHFMLVPVFTVAENVALGDERTKAAGILDLDKTRQAIREISEKYGFHVDPDALVEELPVGVQQRVEIIKALVRKADLLILDEPTAVLTPKETDELMDIIRQLKADGTSIIFISHKLREVKAISDDITVIRRGKVVGNADPTADAMELASLMVGRAVDLSLGRQHSDGSDVALEIRDLTVIDDLGVPTLDHVSLDVKRGEILAVAGVQGNGQTELVEAIMGLTERTTGSIRLDGRELLGRSTKEIINSGVGYVPEDRSTDGVIGDFTIADNLVLNRYDRGPVAKGGSLQPKFIAENADAKIEEFDIRTQSAMHTASQLSGGNQQKVVLAREFSRDLSLFIAAQPTRGVDVGSIEFLHRRILAERDKDVPVVVVSTELDEVAELGDRIAVLFHGKVMGLVPGNTSRDVLGLMMAGSTAEEAFAEAEAANLATKEDDEPQLPGGIA